jgi:hypothetical protein
MRARVLTCAFSFFLTSAGLMAATSAGGAALSAALEDGLVALGLLCRFAGVCTTTSSSASGRDLFVAGSSGAASCSLSDLPMASAVAAADARFGRVWLIGSDDMLVQRRREHRTQGV